MLVKLQWTVNLPPSGREPRVWHLAAGMTHLFFGDIPRKLCQFVSSFQNISPKMPLKNGFWRWLPPTKIHFLGGISPARFLEEYLQCQECLQSTSCKIFVGGHVGNIVQRSLFGVILGKLCLGYYSQKSFFIKFQSLRRSMYQGLWGKQRPRSPNSAQSNSSLVWPRILPPGIYTPPVFASLPKALSGHQALNLRGSHVAFVCLHLAVVTAFGISGV